MYHNVWYNIVIYNSMVVWCWCNIVYDMTKLWCGVVYGMVYGMVCYKVWCGVVSQKF